MNLTGRGKTLGFSCTLGQIGIPIWPNRVLKKPPSVIGMLWLRPAEMKKVRSSLNLDLDLSLPRAGAPVGMFSLGWPA